MVLSGKTKKKAGDSGESPAKLIRRRPLLRDDERLRVHPIRVTQYAQRADLEVIDSEQREPTEGYFLGSGYRDSCPRAQHPARAFECIPHIKSNSAGLIFGLHNGVAAVGPAIDRAELRFIQRRRRSLCFCCRVYETAGGEGCQIVVTRRLDVMTE